MPPEPAPPAPPPTTVPPTPTAIPSSPPSSILRPIYATLLLTCPVILLLPPRKLDLYTMTLCGAWMVSAEELAFGHARAAGAGEGKGVWFGGRRTMMTPTIGTTSTSTIQGAEEDEEEEEERDRSDKVRRGGQEEGEGEDEEEKAGLSGLLRSVWMGDEKPGWQRRRLEREKEELERGRSYGEMIMEQVWEVFPGFGVGRRRRKGGDGDGDGDEVGGVRKEGDEGDGRGR